MEIAKKVLITGVSGFLGSHITEDLIQSDYCVIGLRRKNSNLWRCNSFIKKIEWIDIDSTNWMNDVILQKPDTIIHAAWSGVNAKERNNLSFQIKNMELLSNLLDVANELKLKKFIGLGSQAEYGLFSGKVSESDCLNPNSAYGIVKFLASELLNKYYEVNKLNFTWLRLFSFFGEKENDNWFIPHVIKNILLNQNLDMTPGMQKYAYMYVKDLSKVIIKIIESDTINAGVYNVSSNNTISLKELVEKIISYTNIDYSKANFGALPYRTNQPMLIAGDNTKLESQIGIIEETDFDENLKNTIDFYKKYFKNDF